MDGEQWVQSIYERSLTVIASQSTLIVGVRCPAASEVYDLVQRVLPCLEAAALATGCKYEIKRQALYMDTQQSSGLTDYLRQVSKSKWDLDVPDMPTTASTDFVGLHRPCKEGAATDLAGRHYVHYAFAPSDVQSARGEGRRLSP